MGARPRRRRAPRSADLRGVSSDVRGSIRVRFSRRFEHKPLHSSCMGLCYRARHAREILEFHALLVRGGRDSQDPRVQGPLVITIYPGLSPLWHPSAAPFLRRRMAGESKCVVCVQSSFPRLCTHDRSLRLPALYLLEGPAGGRCETCRRCEVISVHAGCTMTMTSAARVHRCAPGQVQYTALWM